MRNRFCAVVASALVGLPAVVMAAAPPLDDYEALDGFVDLWWDATEGRMLMRIPALESPFIYQVSLPRGVGSNDLGLDRGQLGATRIVRFLKSGPKILLVEDNLRYRATSENPDERRAIEQSFASSVLARAAAPRHAGPNVVLQGRQ